MQYANQSKEQVKAFLKLYALEASTATNIITSVDTGVQEVTAHDFVVSLKAQTSNTDPNYQFFWGFTDVVIIQRRC